LWLAIMAVCQRNSYACSARTVTDELLLTLG